MEEERKEKAIMSREALVVDAMIGICVHDPDTLVEPPSVVRDWATKALAGQIKDASLSPVAKTAFLMTQGAMSYAESEKAAAADLPEQMREFMVSSGLDPAAYDLRSFTEELRADLKILCMAAVRKEAPQAAPAVITQEPAAAAPTGQPSEERIEAWAAEIRDVEKQEKRWKRMGWGLGLLGAAVLAIILFLLGTVCVGEVAFVIAGLVVVIVIKIVAGRRSERACDELSARILRDCEAESLSKQAVVEALWEQKIEGEICKSVLAGVEPETYAVLDIRGRVFEFFGSVHAKIRAIRIKVSTSGNTVSLVALDGEVAVDRFSAIALDYLDQKAYVESIAALATLQSIYTQIAPPGGEILLQAAPDSDRLKQASLTTYQIFSSFDYKPEMRSIYEMLSKRRIQSLLQFLMAAQQVGGDAEQMTQEAEFDLSGFGFRDEVAVGACIDYLGKQIDEPLQRNKVAEAMALIPDERILPYMLQAFGWFPFFPQGIDGINHLGKSVVPQLLAALKSGSGSVRFNTALTLGILDAEGASADMEKLLPTLSVPIERIGCSFALVRAGQMQYLPVIIDALRHRDDNVRHGAAIALEHLSQPIDEALFLKYLDDKLNLVRLRLIRKLGAQGTGNPALWDALIVRFEDPDGSVRSAAVDALARFDGDQIYQRVLPLASGGSIKSRICAYQVLGKLSNPEAILLLVGALMTGGDNDLRRAAISALGALAAVQALDSVKPFLKNDDLSNAALITVLQIGMKDKDAAIRALRELGREPKALVVRALLGDDGAKKQYMALLKPGAEVKNLLGALEFGTMLRDPDFEAPLSKLTTYRKHTNFPGDRYISYLAVKALVGIKLAKAAEAPSGGGQA